MTTTPAPRPVLLRFLWPPFTRGNWKGVLVRTILVIAVGVAVLLLGCQRQLIYYPHGYEPADLDRLPRNAVQVTFATSAGHSQKGQT